MIQVRDLIDALESDEVLSEKHTRYQIPIWFIFRNTLLRTFIAKDIYHNPKSFSATPHGRRVFLFESIILFLRTISRLCSIRKYSILVLPSEVGFYRDHDRKLRNRYVDSFIEADKENNYYIFGVTSGVEIGAFESLPPNYISLSLIDIAIKAWGRVFKKFFIRKSRHFINTVNQIYFAKFRHNLSDFEVNNLTDLLAARLASSLIEGLFYRFLIYVSKPVAILYEEGHYQHKVLLSCIANRASISTLEYQHGVIHHNHDAYYYSNFVCFDKSLQYLFPRHLLSYGSYWHKYINSQSNLVPIGNPYRESRICRKLKSSSESIEQPIVLVIGDGIDTDRYINLSTNLAIKLGSQGSVRFRPHPMERAAVRNLISENTYIFSFDENQDLYESLMDVTAVISEMSTVLYEAVGLVRSVYAIKGIKSDNYYKDIPFEILENIEILPDLLIASPKSPSISNKNVFWEVDWISNYMSFIKTVHLTR